MRVCLGIIFHVFLLKHKLRPLIINVSQSYRPGSNEGSQHMFSLRNKKNCL